MPFSYHSFINNEFVEGVDKKTFEVVNPSTEEVICSVHEATEKDVDIAVAAARKAFKGEWRAVTPQQRGQLMFKLADIVEKNAEGLAAVESLDNGKSLLLSRGDVGAVVGCLRYYAGWADKIEGSTVDIAPDMFHYILKEPVRFPHGFLASLAKLTSLAHRLVSAGRSSPGTFPS